MKLLVMGSGMMGSAAAFDMARIPQVDSVTLADSDARRAREVAARVNRITGERRVRAVQLNARDEKAAAKLMHGHDAALSAVPYFLNLGLARAAVEAGYADQAHLTRECRTLTGVSPASLRRRAGLGSARGPRTP